MKEYRQTDKYKESKKLQDKKYYEKNKAKITEYKKQWAVDNKDRIKDNYTKWYNENRDSIYLKEVEKRKNDVRKRIEHNLRTRLNNAVRTGLKSEKTFKLIGCESTFLIEYISNQLLDGMTWDNYGKYGWHIDHIKPCASFDLTDPEQQKQCFHYTNLQPLWAKDNLSKGKKLQNNIQPLFLVAIFILKSVDIFLYRL